MDSIKDLLKRRGKRKMTTKLASALFILVLSIIINGGSADVDVYPNPGCEDSSVAINCTAEPWIIAVLNSPSVGENASTYHHLWGGVGAPTLITAQTQPNTVLSVDWAALLAHAPRAVLLSPEPLTVFGVTITELILFDDPTDQGTIEGVPAEDQIPIPIKDFEWNYSVDTTGASGVTLSLYTVKFRGKAMDRSRRIIVKVSNTAEEARADEKPRLLAPPAASTVDLILDNLLMDLPNPHPSPGPDKTFNNKPVPRMSGFSAPRFAVRLAVFSTEGKPDSGIQHNTERSIDDGYAPGIFKLDDLSTPDARGSSPSSDGGYVQWRPVCYLTEERNVNKATLPSLSNTLNSSSSDTLAEEPGSDSGSWVRDEQQPSFLQRLTQEKLELVPLDGISPSLKESLAYAVFGDALLQMLSVETIVSFGAPDDGYYTTSDYLVWTYTVGVGSPPQEGLSTTVLIVILVGLGLPLLVLVLAVVGLVTRKVLTKGDAQHQRLVENQDDS